VYRGVAALLLEQNTLISKGKAIGHGRGLTQLATISRFNLYTDRGIQSDS